MKHTEIDPTGDKEIWMILERVAVKILDLYFST